MILNPILKGFNPDPSILRVGDDYYIATSTFEWFPGVQIHHSKDLINWRVISHPLNRVSQLNMRGVPDSCGVWAPCLSYCDGIFYLVYSNVKSFDGVWKDTPNFLVTTNDILGDWSAPVFLNASGFDGSLFHDKDGKKYYLSMLVDHRGGIFFGGIILQEYNIEKEKLIGPIHHIFSGTELGKTEGPHLYKKNGFYYLIAAEGGTEYGHAVTVARSKNISGPYEVHPENPMISTSGNPNHPLQKTGHADLVETKEGRWFSVFLTGRPLTELGRCTLGRETAIAEIEWKNDWPYLKGRGREPHVELPITIIADSTRSAINENKINNRFYAPPNPYSNLDWQTLRIPVTKDWCSLKKRPGYLRLKGQESLSSLNKQSLIARRVQHFNIEATCCVDFNPNYFQQMAGLIFYYNTYHWHYLHISVNDNQERILQIISCDKHEMSEPLEQPFILPKKGKVYLKGHFNEADIQFYFKTEKKGWEKIGSILDGSILSDDYVRDEENRYRPAFTGSFVGICCQDLTGNKMHADFEWFEYKEMIK